MDNPSDPITLPNIRLRVICSAIFLGYGWILFSTMPAWRPEPRYYEIGFLLAIGVFVLAFVFQSSFPARKPWLDLFLIPGAALIGCYSYNKWQVSDVGIGQFLEHASQFGAPLLLVLVAFSGWNGFTTRIGLLLVSFTFLFHGLFALGIPSSTAWLNHPTPEKFVFMTTESLRLENREIAEQILFYAGVVDLIVAVAIWIPYVRIPAFLYMAAWGFLTALARPVAYFEPDKILQSLNQWTPEFLVRTPHWLLPLLLLSVTLERKREKPSDFSPSE